MRKSDARGILVYKQGAVGIPMHFAVLFDFQPGSAHSGEAFHSFCEVFDDFIRVAVLDAVAHAVLDVPL